MTSGLITASAIVFGAAVLIGLERMRPYDSRQKLLRPGLFTDLIGYALAQSYVLAFVIAAIIAFIQSNTTFFNDGFVTSWPLWAQLLFFFVIHDFYIYWFHRLQHHSDVLWRIHEAHHSVKDVDWLSGARSHSLEILINQTIEFAPMVLLGAAPEVIAAKGVMDAVWGMYIHSNVNVRTGKLQWIINGPEMHRWHHARDVAAPGVNFSTKLAIWDWLFGTAYLPDDKPGAYGLPDTDYPKEGWAAYFQHHLHAFRRFPAKNHPQPPLQENAPLAN